LQPEKNAAASFAFFAHLIVSLHKILAARKNAEASFAFFARLIVSLQLREMKVERGELRVERSHPDGAGADLRVGPRWIHAQIAQIRA
jgi:hypothetical protein